jgi:fructokinase
MKITDNNHQIVCFGESLWTTLPRGAEPGGSPVNIARHLKRLGMNPALITRVGLDEEGKRLIGSMENDAISTDFFQVDYELPTGAHPNSSPALLRNNGTQEAWDNITWEPSFDNLMLDAGFFVHGSLPARSEISRKTMYTFLEMTTQRVFNMNLQIPFYTRKAVEDCMKGTTILRINVDELELITGWFSTINTITDRIRILQDRFNIPYIIVSTVSNGCLFNAEGILHEHQGFEKEILDNPASADAFLAGFLYQVSERALPQKTIEYACALQSLVGLSHLSCPDYEQIQIHEIIFK